MASYTDFECQGCGAPAAAQCRCPVASFHVPAFTFRPCNGCGRPVTGAGLCVLCRTAEAIGIPPNWLPEE